MNIKLPNLITICLTLLLFGCDPSPKADATHELSAEGFFTASLSENLALTGNISGNASLWQLKPKKQLYTWQHNDQGSNILYTAISDDEQYALTADKTSLAWWRVSDGKLLNIWPAEDIRSLTISANGKLALIGLADKALYFSLSVGKTLYTFPHDGAVTHLDISKSNLLAITGSTDKTAKLWDLTTGKLKHSWAHKSNLSAVLISPNDAYALTNEGLGTIRLWKPRAGTLYRTLGPKLITLSAVDFSSNSRQIIAGQVSRRIDLWDVNSGTLEHYWRPKKQREWSPSAATIIALSFSEKNQTFYSIASNGYLQQWNANPQ